MSRALPLHRPGMHSRFQGISEQTIAEIRRLKRHGVSQVDIAARLGLNQSTVSKYAREAKKAPKPKSEPKPWRGAAYNARWGYQLGGSR